MPRISDFELERKLAFFANCGYYPFKEQLEAHTCSARFLAISAGSRFGKSLWGAAECAWSLIFPNKRIWIVGPQYSLADKEFFHLIDLCGECDWGDGTKLIDQSHLSVPNKGSKRLSFKWNSWIETKSTEKPKNLLGEELNEMLLAESSQISTVIWTRYLRQRLSSRKGRMFAPSTPCSDKNLFTDFLDRGKSKLSKWIDNYSFGPYASTRNPHYDILEGEAIKEEFGEDSPAYKEQVLGEPVSFLGPVYDRFQRELHLVSPSSLPERWTQFTLIRGIFRVNNAFRNPLVMVYGALDAENMTLYIVDEYYQSHVTPVEMSNATRTKYLGQPFGGIYIDPFNEPLKLDLQNAGLMVRNARGEKRFRNKKTAMIGRIAALQEVFLEEEPSGLKIRVVEELAPNTAREFLDCKWPESRTESRKSETELPLDRDIATSQCVAFMVSFIKSSMGEDIYSAQIA